MKTLNYYNNFKTPPVVDNTITMNSWLESIKWSNHSLIINIARQHGKGSKIYEETKASLPCVTYPFTFHTRKINDNIVGPTGFLYFDIDDSSFDITILDLTKVFAYYKSFGGKGYAVIVKVDGLTKDNFKTTFDNIGGLLGISDYIDNGARKATQFSVLSFDKDLYVNNNSFIFDAINDEIKKVSNTNIIEEKKNSIGVNDTFSKEPLRFNNINDYFVGDNADSDYIIFDDVEMIVQPFIPMEIENGNRNKTMYFVLSQYAMLNPTLNEAGLAKLGEVINSKFTHKYDSGKVMSIAKAIIENRECGKLELHKNKERRIIFNPKSDMTGKEKQRLTPVVLGEIKRSKTTQEIYDVLEDWDFEAYGKITQKKVVEVSGKSIATIKRYWSEFKEYVSDINKVSNTNIIEKKKNSIGVNDTLEETPLIDLVPNMEGWDSDVLGYFGRQCILDDIKGGKIKTIKEVEEIIKNTITKYV